MREFLEKNWNAELTREESIRLTVLVQVLVNVSADTRILS
jgi:hypothetical protein